MTYSDAAKAYADKHCWFAMHARGGPCAMAEGYDAALATVAPVQPRVLTTTARHAYELDAAPQGTLAITPEQLRYTKVGIRWRYENSDATHSAADLAECAPLTLFASAPATTEPVRLTDPDDPRIRAGALVAMEEKHNKRGEYIRYHRRLQDSGYRTYTVAYVKEQLSGRTSCAYYLIAEALDDDEPILDALRVGGFVSDQLASLRAAGFKVVRADS
jgi:hypothetical protein